MNAISSRKSGTLRVFVWGSPAGGECLRSVNSRGLIRAGLITRHLCASAMSFPCAFRPALPHTTSNAPVFSQILNDWDKNLLRSLKETDFDILLIDFIDEMFSLAEVERGRFVTMSPALQASGYAPPESTIISDNAAKLTLFQNAWKRFMRLCERERISDKIIINQLYHAAIIETGESLTCKNEDSVRRLNEYLDALYKEARLYLAPNQFIEYPEELLRAYAGKQNEIISYNYTPECYAYGAESIQRIVSESQAAPGRKVEWHRNFGIAELRGKTIKWNSNGMECGDPDGPLRFVFNAADKYYHCRLNLPETAQADGITINARLCGWSEAHEWSLAWMRDGKQYKIRGKHWLDGQWGRISISKKDLLYKIDNPEEETDNQPIRDIRLLVFGDFAPGAAVEIESVSIWRSVPDVASHAALVSRGSAFLLAEKIAAYLRHEFPDWRERYTNFKQNGSLPIIQRNLDWDPFTDLPANINDVGTFAWSYASLHPAMHAALMSFETGDMGALAAARDFSSRWLESFFTGSITSRDWNDHAVAMRVISLAFIYLTGVIHGFDWRFLARVELAVIAQARLLQSESFYSRDQPIRFHNHGYFQDLALYLVGCIFFRHDEAAVWRKTALERARIMLCQLALDEGGYMISRENSVNYHRVLLDLTRLIGDLSLGTPEHSWFSQAGGNLANWLDLLEYAPGFPPAFGDTHRQGGIICTFPAKTTAPSFKIFTHSGYAIASGGPNQAFYKLVFIASSLSSTHKHCDNLSFTLYFDDIEWLIDPGFYNHEYEKGISRYLRSAAAHNCAHIPETPYSLAPGLASVEGWEKNGAFWIIGAHSCYDGYELRRKIEGHLDALNLKFTDSVHPLPPVFRMRLHCGEEVRAAPCEGGALLSHKMSQYKLWINCRAPLRIIRGHMDGGICGQEFCEYGEIDTLEFDFSGNYEMEWAITLYECSP